MNELISRLNALLQGSYNCYVSPAILSGMVAIIQPGQWNRENLGWAFERTIRQMVFLTTKGSLNWNKFDFWETFRWGFEDVSTTRLKDLASTDLVWIAFEEYTDPNG